MHNLFLRALGILDMHLEKIHLFSLEKFFCLCFLSHPLGKIYPECILTSQEIKLSKPAAFYAGQNSRLLNKKAQKGKTADEREFLPAAYVPDLQRKL